MALMRLIKDSANIKTVNIMAPSEIFLYIKLLPRPTIWSQSKKDESRWLWKVWYRIVALMI